MLRTDPQQGGTRLRLRQRHGGGGCVSVSCGLWRPISARPRLRAFIATVTASTCFCGRGLFPFSLLLPPVSSGRFTILARRLSLDVFSLSFFFFIRWHVRPWDSPPLQTPSPKCCRGHIAPNFVIFFTSSSFRHVFLYSSFPPQSLHHQGSVFRHPAAGRPVYIFVPNVCFTAWWPQEGM